MTEPDLQSSAPRHEHTPAAVPATELPRLQGVEGVGLVGPDAERERRQREIVLNQSSGQRYEHTPVVVPNTELPRLQGTQGAGLVGPNAERERRMQEIAQGGVQHRQAATLTESGPRIVPGVRTIQVLPAEPQLIPTRDEDAVSTETSVSRESEAASGPEVEQASTAESVSGQEPVAEEPADVPPPNVEVVTLEPTDDRGEATGTMATTVVEEEDVQQGEADEQVPTETILATDRVNLLAMMPNEVKRLDKYFYDKIGGGGTGFFRSKERKQARGKAKDAARAQAEADLRAEIETVSNGASEVGEATKAYIEMTAYQRVYGAAKESADAALKKMAEELTVELLLPLVNRLPVSRKPTALELENWKKVVRLDEKAAVLKNCVISKAVNVDSGLQRRVLETVKAQVTDDAVAKKQLENVEIECKSADEGISILGRMLDKIATDPGDMVSLSVELKVSISAGFIKLGLVGKAAKGIDGAMTPGVPVLGDPEHFEVMAQFSLGGGVEFVGLSAGLTAGLFARAGAASTAKAMKAFSYGAYRSMYGKDGSLATKLWSGPKEGAKTSGVERAETWAAMVEEQVFEQDGSAYADVGGEGVLDASINIKRKVAEVNGALGGGAFKHYDRDVLSASVPGSGFAKPVSERDDAARRQKLTKGEWKFFAGFSASTKLDLFGESGLALSGSISGTSYKDLGVEITGTVTKASEGASAGERISVVVVNGIGGLLKTLIQGWQAIKKKDAGSVVTQAASGVDDGGHIVDAAVSGGFSEFIDGWWRNENGNPDFKLDSEIPDRLKKLDEQLDKKLISQDCYDATRKKLDAKESLTSGGATSDSSVQLAVLIGFKGERGPVPNMIRFEVRQLSSKGIDLNLGIVSASVAYDKMKRIFALEYSKEHGSKIELAGERFLGNRSRNRIAQSSDPAAVEEATELPPDTTTPDESPT